MVKGNNQSCVWFLTLKSFKVGFLIKDRVLNKKRAVLECRAFVPPLMIMTFGSKKQQTIINRH